VNEYTIDLHGNDYCSLKGHRIMLEVQSSWFPLYDRNPQKFVDNIFLAKESDFRRRLSASFARRIPFAHHGNGSDEYEIRAKIAFPLSSHHLAGLGWSDVLLPRSENACGWAEADHSKSIPTTR